MMPIYRRRRLSKRTRSRSSLRVPFDPRVLRLRPSANMRPLLHAALVAIPARIRQARSDLEEVTKRLEIFSELNDAYQALIVNLKVVQRDQSQKIEHLESILRGQSSSSSANLTGEGEVVAASSSTQGDVEAVGGVSVVVLPDTAAAFPSIKIETIATEEMLELVGGVEEVPFAEIADCEGDDDQPQLETEIIYDFVV